MPKELALFICVLFILRLLVKDRHLRPMTSWALCLPLLWIVVIGSKPVSFWFGESIQFQGPRDYAEGSLLDRNVFLLLIIAGLLVVLLRRGIDLKKVLASNRWLFAFFLFCGISILWSDYPFVSLKRWVKDIGNVVMVLIILTERDAIGALRAVFARFTYLAIPLSVLFIKYFPDLGRFYNRWTWEPVYIGVGTGKNGLGALVFICGLFLVWDLIQMWTLDGRKIGREQLFERVVLLLMVAWLMKMANSATSLVCLFLGTGILLFIRRPFAKRQIRYLGSWSLVITLLIFIAYSTQGILETFVGLVKRDITLTGRTDLWAEMLTEPINPLIGKGYQSFWLGPGAERLWELYSYHPNQAHNGYLDTYINVGLIGLGLLLAMIIVAGRNLKNEVLIGGKYGMLLFPFLVTIVLYNWTEAVFNRHSILWLILIIAALKPQPPKAMYGPTAENKNAVSQYGGGK